MASTYGKAVMEVFAAARGPNSEIPWEGQQEYNSTDVVWNGEDVKVPTHVLIILGVSVVVATLILTSIRYTLWDVVGTLTCVESPHSDIFIDAKKGDTKSDSDPEVVIVSHKPITSKIRSTLRHLTSIGGFRSRWRGLSMAIVYAIFFDVLRNMLSYLFGMVSLFQFYSPARYTISSVLASIILARWETAWTHIVISTPSSKAWYKRLPARSTWKYVWKASALYTASQHFVGLLALIGFNTVTTTDWSGEDNCVFSYIKVFGPLLISVVATFAFVIPANVALTRVQASLLPDEDEAIVPFDRTFGGKVVPQAMGGTGAIGIVEAWRTFDGSSRRRLIKLYAKIVGIEIALHMLFGAIIGMEAGALMSKELKGMVTNMHYQMTGRR